MKEDWVEVILGEFFDTVTGRTPSKKDPSNYGSEIPFVKPPDITNARISTCSEYLSTKGGMEARLVPERSVLVTCIGDLGRVGYSIHQVAFNQQINAIIPREGVDPLFTYYYAQSPSFRTELERLSTSTTVTLVNKGNFNTIKFPLPPRPEQRAIVGKLEQLFSELDSGIAELQRAQEKLKVYRQAVLKKAFEGELTKTNVSPEQLVEHAELVTKGASPKWQGFDYTSDSSQLLFVTSENVREGFISLEKEKYLPLGFNDIQARSVLQAGDVLFNIVGASIGRAAIFSIDKIANINQAVALIRLEPTLSNAYLNYFLNSETARQAYLAKQVEVARANLSLKDVREIEVPYCSLEEQHQIVEAIESRLSVCDKLEETIATNLQKAEALRQSILKKAFEGRLLSTAELAACKKEKDWCPAGELLGRVKGDKQTKVEA